MTTLADKIEALAQGDHKHGCGGRAYSCTCGYDEDLYLALDQAVIALRERDQAVEALREAERAIAEYYRYWTGGETRGSYDGKPERNGLWRAQHKAHQTLASIEGTGHE